MGPLSLRLIAILAVAAGFPCLAEPLHQAVVRKALAKAGAIPSPRLRVRVAESVKSLTVRGLDLGIRGA